MRGARSLIAMNRQNGRQRVKCQGESETKITYGSETIVKFNIKQNITMRQNKYQKVMIK